MEDTGHRAASESSTDEAVACSVTSVCRKSWRVGRNVGQLVAGWAEQHLEGGHRVPSLGAGMAGREKLLLH